MMTKEDFAYKQEAIDILREGGYKTYANLLNLFDVNVTNDPDIAAAVDINKARILINRGVPREAVSTLLRHEILHRWLEHNLRLEQHVGKDKWSKRSYRDAMLGNIAGDYEISNRGYTDKDKDIVRNLKLSLPDGTKRDFTGLVTELDHPDWADLSIEEMYDKLKEESDKEQEKVLDFLDDLVNQMEQNQQGEEQEGDKEQSSQQGSSQNSENNNSNDSSQSSENSGDNSKDNKPKSKAYIDGFKQAIADFKAGKLRI